MSHLAGDDAPTRSPDADEHPMPVNGLVIGTEGLSERQLRSHRVALRMLVPLAALLAVFVTVFGLLYDSAKVEGPSMLPTLRTGEYLLITRGWKQPARGEILVFRGSAGGVPEEIVKRVIALPGDSVRVQGDRVWVNGLSPDIRRHVVIGPQTLPKGDLVIPAGYVWAMGDNRPDSYDSRMAGPLPISSIHGKVIAVWAPVNTARLLSSD